MFEADFTEGTFGFIDKLLIIFHIRIPSSESISDSQPRLIY
jgi:hypothetical protein